MMDPHYAPNVRNACSHRFAREVPRPDAVLLRRWRQFVRVWLRRNLVPLASDVDLSIPNWLAETSYPEWRKEQLVKEWEDNVNLEAKHYRNKMHGKREFHLEYKNLRMINSRSDAFKVKYGPLFHRIDEEVFKLPMFLKGYTNQQKIDIMRGRLEGFKLYIGSDHTAFEAHMVADVVKVLELQLYSYMSKNLANRSEIVSELTSALAGRQKCWTVNDDLRASVSVEARMSGDMCTSLGNGFTNWMIMEFAARNAGWKQCVGFVEGDDGVFGAAGRMIAEQEFRDLGFEIKLSSSTILGELGFCQLFWTSSGEPVVDPVSHMIKFPWTFAKAMHGGERVMKGLAHNKARSLLEVAPGNPITSVAAWRILELCPDAAPEKHLINNWWENQKVVSGEIVNVKPSHEQRCLVNKLWGVSIREQLEIEKHYRAMQLEEQHCLLLYHLQAQRFPDCCDNFNRYVEKYQVGSFY